MTGAEKNFLVMKVKFRRPLNDPYA